MKFFKSWSVEGAGADNNSSEDGVVGCTTTTDDNLNDEFHPLLDTTNQSSDVRWCWWWLFDKVDFVKLIREGATTATCKISEFIIDIFIIERHALAKAIEKSF